MPLLVWMKSGNLRGSRTKNTGVLLPTRSQLLGRCRTSTRNPHVALGVGRAAFAGHGEKRRRASVCLPIWRIRWLWCSA